VDNLIEHFRDKDRRKEFFKEYKEIEMLYEIISPDADQGKVSWSLALHFGLKQLLQQRDVLDDGVHFVAVEGERLFQLVEDADKVENEAMGPIASVAVKIISGTITSGVSVWYRRI
jgi:hypothetical protein